MKTRVYISILQTKEKPSYEEKTELTTANYIETDLPAVILLEDFVLFLRGYNGEKAD